MALTEELSERVVTALTAEGFTNTVADNSWNTKGLPVIPEDE